MNPEMNRPTIPTFEHAVAFHGHACPGLALGYRAAAAAMIRLQAARAEDEDFVAVVENDACGVDAVQFLCGCTFGKGNLVFRDYGKQVYTFYNRTTGEGLRIYVEPPEEPRFDPPTPKEGMSDVFDGEAQRKKERHRRTAWILSLPENALMRIVPTREQPPSRARIHASSRCAACGEKMMETRACTDGGETLCIPCREKASSAKPRRRRIRVR